MSASSPPPNRSMAVLDVGCGIGFWLVEFWNRGFRNLTGVDISIRSLALARKRADIFGLDVVLDAGNAENLPYADSVYDHVNCQGVVHHTPRPAAAVREIARVLKPGGTASISVYYTNFLVRNWRRLSLVGPIVGWLGGGLKGRGREGIFYIADPKEIVRLYDGKNNPIGISYTETELRLELQRHFIVESIYFNFFPARSLPFRIPRWLHRWLNAAVPFLICANARKPF